MKTKTSVNSCYLLLIALNETSENESRSRLDAQVDNSSADIDQEEMDTSPRKDQQQGNQTPLTSQHSDKEQVHTEYETNCSEQLQSQKRVSHEITTPESCEINNEQGIKCCSTFLKLL